MFFQRHDIIEAHQCLEADYNTSGVLQERPSNLRRKMSTGFQIHRMGVKASPPVLRHGYFGLTQNGIEIYKALEARYGFTAYGPEAVKPRDHLSPGKSIL